MVISLRRQHNRSFLRYILRLAFIFVVPTFLGFSWGQNTDSAPTPKWPALDKYFDMACSRLRFEIDLLRVDLAKPQTPTMLSDKAWTEGMNRWNILIKLYSERCQQLEPALARIPAPLPLDGSVSAIGEAGLKALRTGRLEAAELWLTQAAEQSDQAAQVNLGFFSLLKKDDKQATKWLGRAAFQGSKEAQYALREMAAREAAAK
jgi:hypothetical protein